MNPSNANGGFVPVVHLGVVFLAGDDADADVWVDGERDATATMRDGIIFLGTIPSKDVQLDVRRGKESLIGGPVTIQVGGCDGVIEWVRAGLLAGRARNIRHPTEDVNVVAFDAAGPVGFATARASHDGAFLMVPSKDRPLTGMVTIGVDGTDCVIGQVERSSFQSVEATSKLVPATASTRFIRIKICAPNLLEAPLWGDYHFARSLQDAFHRIGLQAAVDTVDTWYGHQDDEDVAIMLRGRHAFKVDPWHINIMWLISHPDLVPDDEYGGYDHIAVASDLYAGELRRQGLASSVSVMHQATDSTLFCDRTDELKRKLGCLFVGNSRREYRTMVKWCLQQDIPLDLYGSGWDGILPPYMVAGTYVPNADLPELYASHMILLNDHWDSMRDNGFLSNRLFDGSAAATPIITDGVKGLAEVFGDTIHIAETISQFGDLVKDSLVNPAPYLERARRARAIVLDKHTFDHRAREFSVLINELAKRK